MPPLAELEHIIRRNEPLAPYTHLRLGGPAEMLIQPRSHDELSRVVCLCSAQKIPLRVLGSGCNMMVRDEGVSGAILRLSEPAFTSIQVEGNRVRAGTGAPVAAIIAAAARHGLAGLETLVGIPGTVGGAIRTNAGDRAGDIGQFVSEVEVLDSQGNVQVRKRDELRFADHATNLDDPVLLTVEFALEPDSPDVLVKRMRRAWVHRKKAQPARFQAAGRIFKDPRGLEARGLLAQAVPARTKVGGAEVNERDPNYIIIHSGATSRDVQALIDLMRAKVAERFSVALEQEITVW
jgi:UDP-N-acetylmuramate dehydrogenase